MMKRSFVELLINSPPYVLRDDVLDVRDDDGASGARRGDDVPNGEGRDAPSDGAASDVRRSIPSGDVRNLAQNLGQNLLVRRKEVAET